MRIIGTLALVPWLAAAAFAQADSPATADDTEHLNQSQAADGRQINQTYEEQQRQYQEQLRQYKAARDKYESQVDRYRAQRDRYIAERARYHRGEWPTHYRHLTIADSDELMGARVETYAGDRVGRVEDVAKSAGGHIDALRVDLGRDRGHVWIDSADLRFDAREGVVMTNLDRGDLHAMAERD